MFHQPQIAKKQASDFPRYFGHLAWLAVQKAPIAQIVVAIGEPSAGSQRSQVRSNPVEV
jgi:hypothetical protein